MADDTRLRAEVRTSFGKGAARKIRAAHKIPAVIYGHGTDPKHITLPGHETSLIIRKANALLDLEVDGSSQLVLVKDVQKDPVSQTIEHIDLVVIRRGERVTVDVPVHLEGEPAPGTVVALDASSLSLETEATHIPERLVVDVTGLEDGTHILAGSIALPPGATLASDPELLVAAVSLAAATVAEEDEAAAESAE